MNKPGYKINPKTGRYIKIGGPSDRKNSIPNSIPNGLQPLLTANNKRTKSFMEYARKNQNKVQSISSRVLKDIKKINELGFFTVSSDEGKRTCVIYSKPFILDGSQSVDFTVQQANIVGFMPNFLVKSFEKNLKKICDHCHIMKIKITENPKKARLVCEYNFSLIPEREKIKGSEFSGIDYEMSQKEWNETWRDMLTEEGYGKGEEILKNVTSKEFSLLYVYNDIWCVDGVEELFPFVRKALELSWKES